MKSKVFILCFTILLIFGQIVFGQEKGVGNRTVSKLPAKEKRWALIIGVSQYEDGNITPLPGANNDARALRDALRNYAGFDEKQIIMLTTDESKDRQPTKNNILRYLGNLSGTVPKDGLLLVAFSGHGIERQKQAFLLASDTPYNDNVRVLERTAISVSDDFKELVRDTGVGQVIILLDACRNDPSNGRSSSDNPLTQAYKNGFSFDVRNREVEAFATLYATSIGERAYEYTRENKGYFTWAFIEGLKGGAANESGEVTLGTLVRYVEKYVQQQVKIELGGGKLQRPFSIIEGYKAEDLVLSLAKNPNQTANLVAANNEAAFWKLIENSADTEDFENYLRRISNGEFAGIYKATAELKLSRMKKAKAAAAWARFKTTARKMLKYDMIYSSSEGLALVELNEKYGYIDKTGKEVIPLKFEEVCHHDIGSFSESLATLEPDHGRAKSGFIDKTGKVVIPLKYDEVQPFSDGLAAVKLNDKYGFVDKTGKEIIPLIYEHAYSFSEGLGVVKQNNKYGFIDKRGKEIIPFKFDSAWGFSEGLTVVELNGKYGFIDKTGKEVIPLQFDSITSFSEGLAGVKFNEKAGFIDKTGKIVIPFKYDSVEAFSEGLAIVELDGKYGFIDKTGKEVVSLNLDNFETYSDDPSIQSFTEGLARIITGDEKSPKYGFIDKTGRLVVPHKYDGVWCDAFRREGFIGIKLGDKKGFVDIYGNEYFDF